MSELFSRWMGIRGLIQVLLGLGVVGTVFTAAPETPTITSPKSGFTTANAVVTIKGKGKPLTPILVYLDGEFQKRAEVNRNGTWEQELAMVSGLHKVDARYESNSGVAGAPSKPVEIVVKDLLAPLDDKLQISSVSDGQTVKRGPFNLAGTVAPGRRVEITLDGKTFRKAAEEDGTWAFNLYLSPGKRVITVTTAVEPKEKAVITLNVR